MVEPPVSMIDVREHVRREKKISCPYRGVTGVSGQSWRIERLPLIDINIVYVVQSYSKAEGIVAGSRKTTTSPRCRAV